MISVTTTIFKDKGLKDAHHPQHVIEVSDDHKKARVVNPWGGAWGMAKKSGLNNLNRVVSVFFGEKPYTIYSLRAMGQITYFKLFQDELKN